MNNEMKKCAIQKHYVHGLAQRKYGLLTDYELELYFNGYVQGVKSIMEPLGFKVVIDDKED